MTRGLISTQGCQARSSLVGTGSLMIPFNFALSSPSTSRGPGSQNRPLIHWPPTARSVQQRTDACLPSRGQWGPQGKRFPRPRLRCRATKAYSAQSPPPARPSGYTAGKEREGERETRHIKIARGIAMWFLLWLAAGL